MPFSDPIVGGTKLIRDNIQSATYIPGVTGWAIFRDGSAEFNDVTIFGGELRVSDPDGSFIHIYDQNPGDGAVIEINPADMVGHTITDVAHLDTAYNGTIPYLAIAGPGQDGFENSTIFLSSQTTIEPPSVDIYTTTSTVNGNIRLHGNVDISGTIGVPATLTIENDMGKGYLWSVGASFNSGVVTSGTEAIIETSPLTTFEAGRAYLLEFSGGLSGGTFASFNVRDTNLAGTLRFQSYSQATGASYHGSCVVYNATGANIFRVLVLTLFAFGGNITALGTATFERYFRCKDIGLAANFTNGGVAL